LHVGHVVPLGQRRPSRYARADSSSGNNSKSWKVLMVDLLTYATSVTEIISTGSTDAMKDGAVRPVPGQVENLPPCFAMRTSAVMRTICLQAGQVSNGCATFKVFLGKVTLVSINLLYLTPSQ